MELLLAHAVVNGLHSAESLEDSVESPAAGTDEVALSVREFLGCVSERLQLHEKNIRLRRRRREDVVCSLGRLRKRVAVLSSLNQHLFDLCSSRTRVLMSLEEEKDSLEAKRHADGLSVLNIDVHRAKDLRGCFGSLATYLSDHSEIKQAYDWAQRKAFSADRLKRTVLDERLEDRLHSLRARLEESLRNRSACIARMCQREREGAEKAGR